MKRTLITMLSMALSISAIYAQNIPNPGFEQWNITHEWQEPDQMNSGNTLAMSLNFDASVNPTDIAHNGQHALQLTTTGDYMTTFLPGAVAIGPLGFNDVPYADFSGRPDSIEFFAFHNIAENDVAAMTFEFLSSGNVNGFAYFEIDGVESEYVRYVIPVEYENDDAIDQFGFVIANTMWGNPIPESTITIDDIRFIYNNEEGEPMPNGDFESWQANTISGPQGWPNSNNWTFPEIGVTADSDAYEGSYSCKIQNVYNNIIGGSISFLFLGDPMNEDCDENNIQYTPFTTYPNSLNFWYKYECPDPADSASVYITVARENEKSGECESVFVDMAYMPVTDEWTAYTYNFPLSIISEWNNSVSIGEVPFTHLTFAFIPGEIPGINEDEVESEDGATLWLDALNLQNEIFIGVEESEKNALTVYPNPSHDQIRVSVPGSQNSGILELRDMTGKLVRSVQINAATETISVRDLAPGAYLLLMPSSEGVMRETIIVE